MSDTAAAPALLPSTADLRRMLPLLAGRGAYRLILALHSVVLAAAWEPAAFDRYATAMGAATVLSFVTSLGVEKSALKLMPRTRRTGAEVLAVSVLLPGVLAVVCLGWVAVTATDGVARAAGALAVGLGVNQVLVALHRVEDRPALDVANHAGLVLGLVAATLTALTGTLGPAGFLTWIAVSVAVINGALLVALRPGRLRAPRRTVVWAVTGTSVLMAAGEVAAAAVVSLVFVVLSHSASAGAAGALFLTLQVSSLLVKGFAYLLRIIQPQVSVGLRHAGTGSAVRDRVRRDTRRLVVAGTPYLVLVTAAAVVADRAGLLPPAALLLVFYLACAPLIFGMGTINFLLENAGRAGLRRTAAGSVAGLAVAVPAAVPLIHFLDAPGAVAAIALGELVHAAVTRILERTP